MAFPFYILVELWNQGVCAWSDPLESILQLLCSPWLWCTFIATVVTWDSFSENCSWATVICPNAQRDWSAWRLPVVPGNHSGAALNRWWGSRRAQSLGLTSDIQLAFEVLRVAQGTQAKLPSVGRALPASLCGFLPSPPCSPAPLLPLSVSVGACI